jgi:ferritin-like metal-binding protein YciE
MPGMETLQDALLDEIKDLYNAEKQLTKALPKLAKNATNPKLRDALQSHLGETEGHVARLEQIFELLDEKARGKHCAGMAGIIEEGNDMLEEAEKGAVLDAAIIAGAQRAEHYEMAAYGTCIAWAGALGLGDVAKLLNQTLVEEKNADKKLSVIAEAGINEAATAGEDEDDEAQDEDNERVASQPAQSAKSARRRTN